MKTIRIEEVKLGIEESEAKLKPKAAKILGIKEKDILNLTIVKKTTDSRKQDILFVHSLDLIVEDTNKIKKWDKRHRARIHEPYIYHEKTATNPENKKIVIKIN